MPQILRSKKFGEIEVEHGGWMDNAVHIVRLTNGVYCHSNGLPVQSRDEFKKAGMMGDDLLKAHNWFEHRHDAEEHPPQGVILRPDGSLSLEDGTPVTQSAQLVHCLPPGESLDSALKAFFKWQEAQKGPAAAAKRRAATKPSHVAPKQRKTGTAKRGKAPIKPEQANTAPLG